MRAVTQSTTLGLSIPATGGTVGVAPTARTTASGWASWMAWAVAGWFCRTATPRVSSWVWYQALSSLSSALKSWAPAGDQVAPPAGRSSPTG